MRPRLLHLGYEPSGCRRRSCLLHASMRPRLLHLGYLLIRRLYEAVNGGASMRPRLLHLGYQLEVQRAHLDPDGFNEAEAFTPRIPWECRRRQAGSQSFNEAEAFTPRIPARALPWGCPSTAASMRPRLLHLGYTTRTIGALGAVWRFNEAEAFTPRIPSAHISRVRSAYGLQ